MVTSAVVDGPAAGATVSVLGTSLSTTSGADGAYRIDGVPAGEQRLRFESAGLRTRERNVAVPAGGVVDLDTKLPSARNVMTIEGRYVDTSEIKTLERERVEDTGVADVMGQEEIRKTPGSNVVDVAKRSPGVTFRGSFAYIRGLGERYSQTLVNKSVIPSPEPDKRVVPLDLFPKAVVEQIVVVKSYSVDLPGDFSGGSLQIKTRDIPEEDFIELGFKLGYTDGTTFQDFGSYRGGAFDMFGFDDGTRGLPSEVPADRVTAVGPEPPPPGEPGLSDQEVERVGESFNNIWNRTFRTAPPDHRMTFVFGKRIGTLESGQLGITGAVNWTNEYQNIDGERLVVFNNSGASTDPDQPAKPEPGNSFTLDSSTFESNLTGLLNVVYQPYHAQKIGVRNFFSHKAEDLARLQEGFDFQRTEDIRVTRLRWTEKTMFVSQLFGEHLLDLGILDDVETVDMSNVYFEWSGSFGVSKMYMPDDRAVRYFFEDRSAAIQDYIWEDVSRSGSRDFYNLDEDFLSASFDLSIPFEPFVTPKERDPDRLAPDQKIKLGFAFTSRDREFDSRLFRFSVPTRRYLDDFGTSFFPPLQQPESLFTPRNINPDGFELNEAQQSQRYDATWDIFSGYVMADFRIVDVLRFEAGVRVEDSSQLVTTFRPLDPSNTPEVANPSNLDILPGGNLAWDIWESFEEPEGEEGTGAGAMAAAPGQKRKRSDLLQLRLGASQTVTRPEFRELSSFQFTDVESAWEVRGNPDLERTKVLNLDLRLDWFMRNADLISTSVFYKRLDKPIEQLLLTVTGSTLLRQWQNAEAADLYGFEFEARKSFDFLAQIDPASLGFFEDIRAVLNFAWIESEVTIGDIDTAVQTNNERPLQGQPQYIFNVGLVYESSALDGFLEGFSLGVYTNTFGERISAAGANGLEDEVEQPRWSLDVVVAKRFGPSSVRLTARNILDDEYRFTQGDVTTREYRLGWSVGLSYSYRF